MELNIPPTPTALGAGFKTAEDAAAIETAPPAGTADDDAWATDATLAA